MPHDSGPRRWLPGSIPAVLLLLATVARADELPPCSENPTVRCWVEPPRPPKTIDPFDVRPAPPERPPPPEMRHSRRLLIAGGVLVLGSALWYVAGTFSLFGNCPGCGDGGFNLAYAVAGYSIAALEDLVGISLLIAGGVETARERRSSLSVIPVPIVTRNGAGAGVLLNF